MRNQHSNKTIAFFMELIFVLLFFTIASAISVFVMVSAKEKNEHAIDIRHALIYGENLIQTQIEDETWLKQDHFYLNEEGIPQSSEGYYEVIIKLERIEGLSNREKGELNILRNGNKLVELAFLSREEGQ